MPRGPQKSFPDLRAVIEARCVAVPDVGCWLWLGTTSNGYGRLSYGGHAPRYAHRLSFEAFNGPVPAGMDVCHKCDTPSCVNPAHLFVGTASDNAKDMVQKMRSYVAFEKIKTHCKRGHELSSDNLRRNIKTGRRQCVACYKITQRNRKRK